MIHKKGAKVFVRRKSDGTYLVLTGSVWPERPDRSQKPDLPGGIVEDDETFEQGAIRELQEETGIIARSAELKEVKRDRLYLFRFAKLRLVRLVRLELRLYRLDIEPEEITISWEHESYAWRDKSELNILDIRSPYKLIIRRLIKKGAL